jgi:hypothetical protein
MKRTLLQIVETITQKVNEMRTNAAGGEHGDGGASKLEQNLEFFVLGFMTHKDAIIDEHGKWEKEIDVPVVWQKYFYRQDPEYDEYLRLKNKFDGR